MPLEPQPAETSAAAARRAAVRKRRAMGGADHTEQCLGRMSRFRPAAAAAASCAIVLGGCGSGDSFQTDRPILRLSVDQYRIVPQDLVPRPGPIKIVVRNTGRLTHNLVIQVPPEHVDDKPVEVPGARVKSMQPGEETRGLPGSNKHSPHPAAQHSADTTTKA